MKCDKCGTENKEGAKACKKCMKPFNPVVLWMPDWRWHARALGIIYAVVIVLFFAAKFILHRMPPPYHQRQIAPEVTPWLK